MENIETARQTIEACFTPAEVADRWKCSKAAVGDLLRTGKLQGFKVGALWRITPESLRNYEQDLANSQPSVYRNSRKDRPLIMRVV